ERLAVADVQPVQEAATARVRQGPEERVVVLHGDIMQPKSCMSSFRRRRRRARPPRRVRRRPARRFPLRVRRVRPLRLTSPIVPSVSVVLPAYNEQEALPRTVEGFAAVLPDLVPDW